MIKRFFDIVVSALAIVILLPIFLVVYFKIKMKLGSPVLFKQQRPGLNGASFELIKFRSMLDAKDSQGAQLTDKQRLTSFGKKLRATSLDELPELWNVLLGSMSLVGPRPLLVEYLPLYNERQKKRHEVKPGITGWAQINGRNAINWEEKFELDVWYVENQTFWLDMKILILTVVKVLRRSDISASNHATMPVFEGTKRDNK